MAPAKAPVFAVCGSMNNTASEPSRGYSKSRKKPSPSSSYHRYSSNLDPPPPSSSISISSEDLYSDVFGGPPKYASLSSHLSHLSLKLASSSSSSSSRVSDAPSSRLPPSFPSTFANIRSNSIKHRPTADEVACCRDNARKHQPEDIKRTPVKDNDLSSPDLNRESTLELKPLTRGTNSLNGSEPSSPPRVPSSEKNCDVAQRYACSPRNMKMESRRFKGNINEHWITVKDVRFTTEPSRFPPPSRPPPELSSCDDNYACINAMDDHIKQEDNTQERTRQNSEADLNLKFDSKELNSMDYKIDAMEMADVKLKVSMESKKKARLIIEKRLREKRRERHHKNMNDSALKMDKEQWCKNVSKATMGIHQRSGVLHCDDEAKFESRDAVMMQEPKDVAETRANGMTRLDTKEETNSTKTSGQLLGERKPDSVLSSNCNEERIEITPRSKRNLFEKAECEALRRCIEKELELETRKCDVSESRKKQQEFLIRNSGQCANGKDTDSKNVVFSVQDVHRDLSSVRGSMPVEILFPVVEGETLDRQKARWEQTSARMAKALQEKKLRDLQIEREQAERNRAGEMLDDKIRNWAAGKQGNLQALLCSLQYILWPECGWQPVSPADVSSAVALKKFYRKATLCVHPDKLQQRGATIMQKYIAEKVFDLLKEASFRSI